MHGVVPDHNISCLTVSSIHPALQMLQLPMNIRGKGLEILTPALPAPPTVCLPSVYLLPCITFSYTTVMMKDFVRMCGLTSQDWLLLTTNSTSQTASKQPAFLVM